MKRLKNTGTVLAALALSAVMLWGMTACQQKAADNVQDSGSVSNPFRSFFAGSTEASGQGSDTESDTGISSEGSGKEIVSSVSVIEPSDNKPESSQTQQSSESSLPKTDRFTTEDFIGNWLLSVDQSKLPEEEQSNYTYLLRNITAMDFRMNLQPEGKAVLSVGDYTSYISTAETWECTWQLSGNVIVLSQSLGMFEGDSTEDRTYLLAESTDKLMIKEAPAYIFVRSSGNTESSQTSLPSGQPSEQSEQSSYSSNSTSQSSVGAGVVGKWKMGFDIDKVHEDQKDYAQLIVSMMDMTLDFHEDGTVLLEMSATFDNESSSQSETAKWQQQGDMISFSTSEDDDFGEFINHLQLIGDRLYFVEEEAGDYLFFERM